MDHIWSHLEMYLQQFAPTARESLRPGAEEVELRYAEAFIPLTFPEELKSLYTIHNGQGDHTYRGQDRGLINGWHFLSLKRMCQKWLLSMCSLGLPGTFYNRDFACPSGERYPALWHPHWLPFMAHWMGPSYCIDLAPESKGNMGQILFYNDRYKDFPDAVERAPSIRVIASGIEAFFSRLVSDLEAGKYRFDEATGMLWDAEMWSALVAREAHISGFDEETGEYWKENESGYLKREYTKRKREADPVSDELDWEDLYRSHPHWNPVSVDLDEYPF